MKPFLTAYWKNLIMLNYAAEPSALQKYLPAGAEIDTWNNTCYVSLVGFMFLNTKVKGLSIPFFKNFEEFNLRFYVKFKDNGTWKRGVVFVKEIVPRKMISSIANSFYGEHYYCYPMKNLLQEYNNQLKVRYEFLFMNEWNHIEVSAQKEADAIVAGSEEEFITEHYWGYTKLKDNLTSEYQVQHPRWNIHKVVSHSIQVNTNRLYGSGFHECLQQQPFSVFIAQGSDVKVYPRKLWKF